MTPYIAACAGVCILASVACWGMARRYGLPRRGLWPFLALAGFMLLGHELLPGPAEARAGLPVVAPEERVRRSAGEIEEANYRLADELAAEGARCARPSWKPTTPP